MLEESPPAPDSAARSRVGGHASTRTLGSEVDEQMGNQRPRRKQNPMPGCGACRACKRGRPSVCLLRETAPRSPRLHARGVHPLQGRAGSRAFSRSRLRCPTRAAALTEPTAIAIHTVNLSGAQPGDRVLVTGGGPVGLLTTAVLCTTASTMSPSSEPSTAAAQASAWQSARARRQPDDLPRAPMGRPRPQPFTVAVQCSGDASAAEAAFDQLDYAGTPCSSGPVTTCRASTTTARLCWSS